MKQPPSEAPRERRFFFWIGVSVCAHVVVGLLLGSHRSTLPEVPPPIEISLVTLPTEKPGPETVGGTGQAGSETRSGPPPTPDSPHVNATDRPRERETPKRRDRNEPLESSEETKPPERTKAPDEEPLDDASLPPPEGSSLENPSLTADTKDVIPRRASGGDEAPDIGLPAGPYPFGVGGRPGGSGAGGSSETADGLFPGKGLLTVPEVKEKIKEDGRRTIARNRVARALVSPQMSHISTKLEEKWQVKLDEVRRWPSRPETRVEYWAPEGMDDQAPAPPCTYQRYSLAVVEITVDRDGFLVSTKVLRSAHSRKLDREVIDLIRKTSPFPAPAPTDLDEQGLSRSVWDIGARDYGQSNCFYTAGPKLVKDIVLLEAYQSR